MTIIGQRIKNKRHYSTFGCPFNRQRGNAICTNNLTISEMNINDALIGALTDVLTAPDVVARFVDQFAQRLATTPVTKDAEMAALDQDLAQAENAVRHLADAVARSGWSEVLADHLRQEEDRLRSLKGRKAASQAKYNRAQAIPDPKVIKGYLSDLCGSLEASPERGRELLRRHVGSVKMEPKGEGPDRAYHATGAFNLTIPAGSGRVLDKSGSGGRI